MGRLRASAVLTSLLAFTLVCTACNTPTLPIPPPIIDVVAGDPGYAIVSGTVDDARGATYVLAFNQTTQSGVLELVTLVPVAGFRIEIAAESGDSILAYGITARFEVGQPSMPKTVP